MVLDTSIIIFHKFDRTRLPPFVVIYLVLPPLWAYAFSITFSAKTVQSVPLLTTKHVNVIRQNFDADTVASHGHTVVASNLGPYW